MIWLKAALLALVCTVTIAAGGFQLSDVMDAIHRVESGGKNFAIFDNSTRRSYSFPTKAEATKMANYLISLNHNIDMGDYQINSVHLSRGWSVERLFDSAFNRSAAETVFKEWFERARKLYGETDLAWQRAIGAYNAGGAGLRNGNQKYTNLVLRAMGITVPALDKGSPDGAGAKAARALDEAADTDDDDEDADEDETRRKFERAKSSNEKDEALTASATALLVVLLGWAFGIPALKVLGRVVWSTSKKALKEARKQGER